MKSLSKEYAEALFQISEEKGQTREIFEEFNIISSLIKINVKFMEILSCPNIIKSERIKIIEDTFKGKVNLYLVNFLKTLVENRDATLLFDCLKSYTEIYNKKYGMIKVKAITAVVMNDTQKAKLRLKLESMTGRKILLSNYIDPLCIGGMKIIYEDALIDLSVKHTLDSIRSSLSGGDIHLSESW